MKLTGSIYIWIGLLCCSQHIRKEAIRKNKIFALITTGALVATLPSTANATKVLYEQQERELELVHDGEEIVIAAGDDGSAAGSVSELRRCTSSKGIS